MKILFVNYEYPPLGGGGGVAMRDIAVELAKKHEVHVLTSAANDLKEEEVVDGVRIFRAPVWMRHSRSHASFMSMITFWPVGISFGTKKLADFSYDVINTWFAIPSGPTGIRLARDRGTPHVLTLAGGDIYDPSKWYTPDKNPVLGHLVRKILRQSDKVAAVSGDLAKRACEIYGYQDKIDVISLGVSPSPVQSVARHSLNLSPDAIYMISVGRLVRRKNLDKLIEAMALLNHPALNLLILGDGPEKDHLADLAEKHSLKDKVHLKGFVSEEEKHQYLQAADMFTLPSQHEAFGLVYVEAMHAGLPVIASKPGGQEDYLIDGETGYLVPRDDVSALKEAIQSLISNPKLRQSMGANAKKAAMHFTPQITAQKYEDLFTSMLPHQQNPGAKKQHTLKKTLEPEEA